MNNGHQCLVGSIARVAAIALSLAVVNSPAQAAAPQSKPAQISKPLKGGPRADWTGTWVIADSYLDRQDGTAIAFRNGREENDVQYKDLFLPPPKFVPEIAKLTKKYADAMAKAAAEGQPLSAGQCAPNTLPYFWSGLYAFEIIQSPTQINLFQELGEQTRRIYLDGRKHPSLDDAEPLILGHSIGRWEGDTLVVDTVNINTNHTIFGPETNHTEKSHVVERFSPVGENRIDVDVTFSNPDVLAEPYHVVRRLRRKPDTEIMDYGCDENNRNPVGADGREKAIISSK